MVHGKALIEMGKGSTRMHSFAWGDGTGGLSLRATEPGEIGRHMPTPDDWTPENSDVLITFDNPESVHNFIKSLHEVLAWMKKAREETVTDKTATDETEDPGSTTREYHKDGTFTEYKED